jgi:hypothetical protein
VSKEKELIYELNLAKSHIATLEVEVDSLVRQRDALYRELKKLEWDQSIADESDWCSECGGNAEKDHEEGCIKAVVLACAKLGITPRMKDLLPK